MKQLRDSKAQDSALFTLVSDIERLVRDSRLSSRKTAHGK